MIALEPVFNVPKYVVHEPSPFAIVHSTMGYTTHVAVGGFDGKLVGMVDILVELSNTRIMAVAVNKKFIEIAIQ